MAVCNAVLSGRCLFFMNGICAQIFSVVHKIVCEQFWGKRMLRWTKNLSFFSPNFDKYFGLIDGTIG